MPDLVLAFDLLVVLLLALLGGFVARKLHQPLILGYVLAGMLFGGVLLNFVHGQGLITPLAEFGVALLMFSLGIEFSFSRLSRVKNIVFWGGVIQILSTILWGILIFPLLGFDFYPSLFLASCFSLSSTAVVTKILTERGELDSLPGEIMVGWLLIQDLAVLPMILILPQIAVLGTAGLSQLLLVIGKAAVFLFSTFVLGRTVIPRILQAVAALNSREILVITVVTLCLGAAFGTYALGLSFSLGAFLAGIIISESAQNHAVFSEVRPLRDIFSIIFFVSLGMLLTPSFLISHLGIILALMLAVIIIKFFIVLLLVFFMEYHFKVAFLVAAGLVQVGEFSFILARTGVTQNLISQEVYSLIISVALLTIVITPFLMSGAPRIHTRLNKLLASRFPKVHRLLFARRMDQRVEEELSFDNHIVICGYGRVGGWFGRALELCQIPFVVIDYNQEVVRDLKNKGVPVVYGDPADIDVLNYAKVDKARIVVVAIPDRHTQELVISNALSLNPKINIVCRIHHQEDRPRLKALGVQTLIQPEFEASLSMIHRILQELGFDSVEVSGKIKRIKLEYGMG